MRTELSDGSNVMRIRSTALGVAICCVLTSSAASAALCTRLPLSDVALKETDAASAARKKLNQYAIEKLTERGWSGDGELTTRNETVTCTPYFSFGAIAAGYRCLVTATFCANRAPSLQARVPLPAVGRVPAPRPAQRPVPSRQVRQTPPPRPTVKPSPPRETVEILQNVTGSIKKVVKLRLKGSSYEISGVLKKYDKVSYVIAPPNSENITVPADRFDCVSGACPKVTN